MPNEYNGRLLIVDDDRQTCAFWKLALSEAGFLVDLAHNLGEMKDFVSRYSIDAVLLDLNLGHENGLDGLPFLVSKSPLSKVFVLTAHATVETAIWALQNGATGYITKDTAPDEIAAQIKKHTKDQVAEVVSPDVGGSEFARVGMIGQSKAFMELCSRLQQLKNVDSTILLLGESGTGKEVIARSLHKISNRSQERFEAINCAAIPENLLESELFGHKRGAFTDAKVDRKGILELCSQGTLLFDEIGDMPLSLQAKLLRVLQERVVTPVGSATPIKIQTRVIAATHRDLIEEVQSGRFREDLYYRLSVVPLYIPPLRHRKEDIPLLVESFINEFNQRFNRDIGMPADSVMRKLIAYDWPGNIRELRNAIERAVVLTSNDHIRIEDLFQHLHLPANPTKKASMASSAPSHGVTATHSMPSQSAPSASNSASSPQESTKNSGSGNETELDEKIFQLPLTEAKQAFEKIYLESLLNDTGGNISETSKRAGRYRADIYRLLERYDLHVDEFR
ncbi:MAG: sigma-54-dependent Fis family transcriptional regulator [Proteobacteria bacterium]|nr:MAG: sigma-54-dependent Fis family transcriptional regulator [Pseudomonadota bacterium]